MKQRCLSAHTILLANLLATIERLQLFKKTVDQDDGRRRREGVTLSLRKAKKDDRLSKRRMAPTADLPSAESYSSTTSMRPTYTVIDLPHLVKVASDPSGSKESLLEAARAIRRMLSVSDSPPVKEVIDAGALPPLVKLLMRTDSHEIQTEASWALTNVASTSFTSAVAEEENAIRYLVDLLRSPVPDVREQCAWCLGNIAGDGAEYRDRVLRQKAMEPL